MTTARHRTTDQELAKAAGDMPTGAAPGGMWWVAWRQHRLQAVGSLLIMAIIAVGLLAFRLDLGAHLRAVGCTALTQDSCAFPQAQIVFTSEFSNTWQILRGVLIAAPVVLGVFGGATIFPQEFERRTNVFALTQSVGRLRWWVTKVTIAGVPMLLGLLGLGFVMQWAAAGAWFTNGNALINGNFQVRSIMPAAFGLVAFAIAITAGIVIRSLTASIITGLIVAGGLTLAIAFPVRPHLLPSTRNTTPIAAQTAPTPGPNSTVSSAPHNAWLLSSGFLNAKGDSVALNYSGCTLPQAGASQGSGTPATDQSSADAAATQAIDKCMREQGIVAEYTDYLPASTIWPVRLIVLGICIGFAAVFLAAGALRLRRIS